MTGLDKSAPGLAAMTVSQLNATIKRALADHLPGTIHLTGEISNLTRPASGHLYLTLKDESSEIRAVMWRSAVASLKFKPADGLQVIATGSVDVYEPRGQYQFYIRKLEPRGVGALELAFRQLCDRLSREGLFDPGRKKPIPRFPRRIAVVTSETGAAIRDILHTLQRRFQCVSVLLYPVRVQGEGAAEDIAAAIGRLNDQAERLGGIDVMIVGRGGGSLEDLWAFNEEMVARAIYASRIPVISAVGHEVDVSVSDLVADLRAPTPTAAGELAVPVLDEVLALLNTLKTRAGRAVRHQLDLAHARFEVLYQTAWLRDPLIPVRKADQRVDEASARLRYAGQRRIGLARQRLHQMEMVISAIQPSAFLRLQQNRLDTITHRMQWVLTQWLRKRQQGLEVARNRLERRHPLERIQRYIEKISQLEQHLNRAGQRRMQMLAQTLSVMETRLENTSYRRTLQRGYTITRRQPDHAIVSCPDMVRHGDRIVTETAAGPFTSAVDAAEPQS
ncbi:MAG: exodeoxyribonuclease VII large subunit [Phycisphaerales bacterium]|nr:exodeoxyribonuclease VII large subunit [Phycisphaerales bacterium]